MFNYPYGDSQQLNLDWVLEQWQETKESIDNSLQGEIDRVEAAITDLLTARDQAVAAKTAAETAATSASGYASTASTAASTATAQATAAGSSAALAGSHASNAQTSETNAGLQATAAGNSAAAAAVSATNAGNSETAAAGSATNAAAKALVAEGWAEGTQAGTPVASGSPYYEHNAAYWAGEAQRYQGYSEQDAEFAEAMAKGTVNGTPVSSGDPGYHDNASYYKDAAAAQAAAAAASAASADGTNAQKMIAAPEEATSTASAAHAAGTYFRYNSKLYKATQDIALGGTITPNTNCVEDTVCAELTAQSEQIDTIESAIYLENVPIGDAITWFDSKCIKYTDGLEANTTAYRYTDYIDISGYSKIIYPRVKTTANPTSKPGIAFYNSEKTFISGISGIYKSTEIVMVYDEATVPQNAKYIRLSEFSTVTRQLYLYDALSFQSDFKDRIETLESHVEELDVDLRVDVDLLGWTLGRSINAQGTTVVDDAKAISHYEPITKPFYRGGSLVDSNDKALNCFVCQYNNGVFISRTPFNVLNKAFTFDNNCTHFRIVIGYADETTMTQEIINTYFKPYTKGNMNYVYDDLERVNGFLPNYSGKKISILGDSISTFVPSADKVDGKAPEGCTTNYPGNPVQYENSNVTSVELTWWGQVIDELGLTLGINESWAGSTIGYNSSYTDSGKYTADNCMCSETRIGHLDENGTPDLIIVFGGTNDINHHKDGSDVRFAVGELDTTHNPYDFDNFSMVTDTYYGSITTMLLRIQHTYPNATILMLLPYFCTYTHTSSGDIATPQDQNDFSKAAIDVCNFLGVEYLDLRTIINLYDVSTLLFDNLHPKANGMAAIAKAVIHKLNLML